MMTSAVRMLKRRPGARWTANPLDEVRDCFGHHADWGSAGGRRDRDRPSDGSLAIDQTKRIDERRVVVDEERILGNRMG